MQNDQITLELQQLERGLAPRTIQTAIGCTFGGVYDLDQALVGHRLPAFNRKPAKLWVVDSDMNGNPFTMTAEAEPTGRQATDRFVRGVRLLEETPQTPEYFTPEVLGDLRKLGALIGKHVVGMTISSPRVGAAKPTAQIVANIDIVLGNDGKAYSEWTSLSGRLDRVDVRTGSVFEILDALTGHSIRCHFGKDLLDKVRSSFGSRIEVVGLAKFNSRGEPLSMKVDDFETFPSTDKLPSYDEVRGLNVSNGIDAVEYLSELNDDGDD